LDLGPRNIAFFDMPFGMLFGHAQWNSVQFDGVLGSISVFGTENYVKENEPPKTSNLVDIPRHGRKNGHAMPSNFLEK
jgi:hypothetical protein